MYLDQDIAKFVVYHEQTILETLRKISKWRGRIMFVVDSHDQVFGVVTNGDILRWLIDHDHPDLNQPITLVANRKYRFATASTSRSEIAAALKEVLFVPLLNEQKQIVSVACRDFPSDGLRIGDRCIGEHHPCYVIAEIGNNHNGSPELARRLVDAAVDAGADCVKFQMRQLEEMYRGYEEADSELVGENLGAEYTLDLLRRFQLSNDELFQVFDYCKQHQIEPLCTPWDEVSLQLLEDYGMKAYKIASADFTNHELLRKAAATKKPIICSTGMTTEEEIDETIGILTSAGSAFVLLHCNSTYPAPFSDIHLNYIKTLKNKGTFPVGYSGHERGVHVSIAAVALGANVIERHLTVDRAMEGNDHKASLLPNELAEMVRGIREVESSLGSGGRRIFTQGEMINRVTLAKSLMVNCDLERGETIRDEMLEVKSPGRGLQPMYRERLVGRQAIRAMKAGDFFYPTDIQDQAVARRHYAFSRPFGLPVRYHDLHSMMSDTNLDLVEFHLSYKDLELDPSQFLHDRYDLSLVVHCPELFQGDHTLDLCSDDRSYREESIQHLQRVIDLTVCLKERFPQTESPPIIVNVGGFSEHGFLSESQIERCRDRLIQSLDRVDASGVELIPQTMPPFPWHFGGQRFHNLFVSALWTREFCDELGYRICFDTSHSLLACSHYGWSFYEFTETLAPYTAHYHLADAAGSGEEGLQIGEGQLDFPAFARVMNQQSPDASFIPEIWQGHENNGDGFWRALERLEKCLQNPAVDSLSLS